VVSNDETRAAAGTSRAADMTLQRGGVKKKSL